MQIVIRRYFNIEEAIVLPTSVIVKSDGKILNIFSGTDPNELREMENQVRKELGVPTLKKNERGVFDSK